MTAAPGTAPGGGAQEAATPGQAAYEAWRVIIADGLGWKADEVYKFSALNDIERGAWEAAANAVTAKLLAEAARYKAERDAARGELRIIDADRKVLKGERDMARAGRDRYCEALERIATLDDGSSWTNHSGFIAREALEAAP